jgi:hypothetical protein
MSQLDEIQDQLRKIKDTQDLLLLAVTAAKGIPPPGPIIPPTQEPAVDAGVIDWPVKVGASTKLLAKGQRSYLGVDVPGNGGKVQYRLGAVGSSDANAQTYGYWSTVPGDRTTIIQVEGAQFTPGSISQSLGNDIQLPGGRAYLNIDNNRYNEVNVTLLLIP